MDLDTVRALQHSLIERGVNRPTGPNGRPEPPIALGITGSAGSFQLAVRIVAENPATMARVSEILTEARGEAETRVIHEVTTQAGPILGGPINGRGGDAGTLGAVVRDVGSNSLLFLSASHVLRPGGVGDVGDPVCEPIRELGDSRIIGRLLRFTTLDPRRGNRVDAAVASICANITPPANYLPGLGAVKALRTTELEEGVDLGKVGFGTGQRWGTVKAWELKDLTFGASVGNLLFHDQIEIQFGRLPFSTGGDSGSLVVDEQLDAVGLLVGGNGVDLSYATPIAAVLEETECSFPP